MTTPASTTDKPTASLTIHGIGKMNKKNRSKVASWLRRHADFIVKEGGQGGNITASRYRAGMRIYSMVLVMLCLLVSGCAANRGNLHVEKAGETLDVYHEGKEIKQRHVIKAEWGVPGDVSYIRCRPEQLSLDAFWGIRTCSGTLDSNTVLAVDLGRVTIASYRDLVLPATISGLFQVAAFGTLGAVMPAMKVDVRQNALTGSRFSTGYFNSAPAPAWLGQ